MSADVLRYLRLLLVYRRYAAGVLVLGVLVTITYRLEPLFLLIFVNEVTLKSNLNLLVGIVVSMIACGATAYYLYGVAKYHRGRLGQMVLADLRRSLFARLMKQPPLFFEANPPGKLVALTAAEVDALDAVGEAFFWGAQTILAIFWIVGICLAIDRQLALLLLVPLPLMALLMVVDGRMRSRNQLSLEHQSRLISFLKLRLSNAITAQAFLREESDAARLGVIGDELVDARARTDALAQVSLRLFEFSQVIVLAAILLVGGIRFVHRENMTLGSVTAVFAYANGLFIEITAMYGYLVRARLATVALRRIFALLDAEPPIREDVSGVELIETRGQIAFDRVSFRYSPEAPLALNDVSFEVNAGEFLAIIGLSGSGKSTLFRLLLRFYDPSRGAVRLDGHDLKSLRLSTLRRQMGLATQEAVIFQGSVAENIGYGREGASQEEIVEAARAAVAHDFVTRLPAGYQTLIGEGATDLSGGQRHRIALARVFLKGPPVLLMDEVTAALDAKTEAELQDALRSVARGRTTIVIAHRLATVIQADRIIVMDEGQIVQQGRHDELYAQKNGLYRFLFDRQFKDPLESGAPERVARARA